MSRDEDEIRDFLARVMPPQIAKTIVDVGANDSALFSKPFMLSGWKAVLIEPQEECAKRLRKAYPDVPVVQKACHIAKGTMKLFHSKSGDTEVATLNDSSDPWFDMVRSERYTEVECETLTNILDEIGFDTEIGILKVDAESWDPYVIQSLDFGKYKPVFVVTEEYYWEARQLQMKYNILEDAGYVLLGFVGYNSIWRKKDENVNYTNMILRDFLTIKGIYPKFQMGYLPMEGKWKPNPDELI